MSLQIYVLLFAVAVLLIHYIRRLKSPLIALPLPPGPKPLPIIGNILDIPSEFSWETYDRWFKEFQSDILHVSVVGAPIIIVNTYEAAVELLEKRSALYSSRVPMPMAGELMGWEDFDFAMMPNAFNVNASKQFEPHVLRATHEFLLRLVEHPGKDSIMDHLRHLAASTIIDTIYGIKILPYDDPYVDLAEKAMRGFTEAAAPGRFYVDFFPWLKYVPKWLPGAGFRRQADEWAEMAKDMIRKPFEAAKENMKKGHITPSFISQCLETLNSGSSIYYDEKIVQDVAAVAYAAGSDTTVSVVATFVLVMVLDPEIQKRAQAELDGVISGRLPTLADQVSLPYVTAVVYETFRWKASSPLAGPRRLVSDDIYNGYRIPAGSMVIPNVWTMLYDEEMYPNPTSFNPDRFLKDGKLNPEVRDPTLMAFGFGRRICPGRHMAYSSVWIAIASILATMSITKALDEDGKVIEPSGEYVSGLIQSPKPFACCVAPRSSDAEVLIRESIVNDE